MLGCTNSGTCNSTGPLPGFLIALESVNYAIQYLSTYFVTAVSIINHKVQLSSKNNDDKITYNSTFYSVSISVLVLVFMDTFSFHTHKSNRCH